MSNATKITNSIVYDLDLPPFLNELQSICSKLLTCLSAEVIVNGTTTRFYTQLSFYCWDRLSGKSILPVLS